MHLVLELKLTSNVEFVVKARLASAWIGQFYAVLCDRHLAFFCSISVRYFSATSNMPRVGNVANKEPRRMSLRGLDQILAKCSLMIYWTRRISTSIV
jgi:hypothetical protein